MIFKSPWLLLLIPVVFFMLWWWRTRNQPSAFRYSSTQILKGLPVTWRVRFAFIPFALRVTVVALCLIALAGPRSVIEESKIITEGIDIVLVLDTSQSMLAEDFKIKNKRQSRINVVKSVVQDFIDRRVSDKIGLIAFGKQAYTVCPLTTDYTWLKTNLDRLKVGLIDDSRTAIGSAISSAVLRLKESDNTSKIVILLTDGSSNWGNIDPNDAAKIAQSLGIKIYTIGAGTMGNAPFPRKDPFGRKVYQNIPVKIDEATLQAIADTTDGKYYRATDTQSLEDIYEQIDQLEKTEIQDTGYREYQELFWIPLLAAMGLLLFELFLSHTLFLKVP